MPVIHPTASVGAEVELAADVEIGPWCVLTGRVRLGPGVRLVGNIHLAGPIDVGQGTGIYPFACVGFPPQDVKFKRGDRTAGVVIGRECILREHVTIHAASNDHTPTRVGDRAFMMVGAHLGHDVQVGNGVTLVNLTSIGGHARIDDGATLGGGCVVHQHCRVGRLAFMSGASGVSTNVPPFCVAWGRNELTGINLVGLRRAGVPREDITEIRRAYREVLRVGMALPEMIRELQARGRGCAPIAEMARFVAESKRPICPGRTRARGQVESELEGDAVG